MTQPHSPDDTALLAFLQSHDIPCPLCKYNLRNLTHPRCPECGRDLKLTVGLTEPVLWRYVLFLTALLLPAGVGLLLWAVLLLASHPEMYHWYNFRAILESVSMIAFQVTVAPAAAAIFLRRPFLRLAIPFQFLLCFLAGGWCFLTFAMFATSIILER